MGSLISKDDDLTKSAPIVGYEILKMLTGSEDGRISIFDAARRLRKTRKVSARSMFYGMLFLHSLGLIDFDEPYLTQNVEAEEAV